MAMFASSTDNMRANISNSLAQAVLRPRRARRGDENNGTVSVGSKGCLIISEMGTTRSLIDGLLRIQRN